ncbi:MAG: OmpA family protein [Woeseiaceae bacterium]|nr:OmpA family protein [Woeseiaceae bacterium]
MSRLTGIAAAALIAFLFAGDALADAEAGRLYFSVMGSYVDDDQDRGIDDGFNGGQTSIGYAVNDWLNIEGLASYAYHNVGNDQRHLGLGIDLQRVFRRAERFSPYLHLGAGFFEVNPNVGATDDGSMFSGGAGFYLDLFNSRVALRGEWRHRVDSAGPNDFNDNLLSLGLQIPFGGSGLGFADADSDGVADQLDRCPNTPAYTFVDSYGCPIDGDKDGDGIKDSSDQCPDTAKGVAVDARGCPKDSDGDGVSDDKDKCEYTVRGAVVGADGCELDGDKDGVVDRLDECPKSMPGVQVDIRGCEIRGEISLPGVNFQSNSDRLLPGATNVLDEAVATLKKNPTISFEIAGHTDSDGAAAYNESLSARRATTVYDYLASRGIDLGRMTVRGYGEAQPIADNATAAGKAQNRRVVLRILRR